jgi:hypothetical protein
MLTIQYLEDSPDLTQLDPKRVVDKLRAAAERLPFTHLLIGWHLPIQLLEACRMEAEQLGMRFIRWQPLLTSDKVFNPKPDRLTESLMGHKLVGYRGLPEFTFACPNHPAVQEAVNQHLSDLVGQGVYQGFFLDRVRFPSPSANPIDNLACFCEFCHRKAAEYGCDLEEIRQAILRSTKDEKGHLTQVQALLSGMLESEQAEQLPKLVQFLSFRKHSILELLATTSHMLREAHLEIGLDCYSPCLTHMVGQDLGAMSEFADWIKLMSYAHTLGPAGLPYELLGLFDHLIRTTHLKPPEAMRWMSNCFGLPLPAARDTLEEDGFSPSALEREVRRGVEACTVPVLAGVELMQLEGVTHFRQDRFIADLESLKRAGAAGLAISWDLLHIPLERLDLVRRFYYGN